MQNKREKQTRGVCPLPGQETKTRSKKLFFLVWTYVVALVIQFLKWAHFPLNSRRLPRYESTKMGRFRAFSAKCMEIWLKSVSEIGRQPLFGDTGWSDRPKYGYTPSYHGYLGHHFSRFFIFLFFLFFWAIFSQILAPEPKI